MEKRIVRNYRLKLKSCFVPHEFYIPPNVTKRPRLPAEFVRHCIVKLVYDPICNARRRMFWESSSLQGSLILASVVLCTTDGLGLEI